MHCIQGSDAHRLYRHATDANRLGWGDRVTEILLPEPSFEAIRAVFLGSDFSRTRPYRPTKAPFDHVQAAREEGPSIVTAFHESMAKQGGRLHAIVRDVVAMANTNGGTLYIGVKADPKTAPVGIPDPDEAIAALRLELQRKIVPPLEVKITTVETQGRQVLQLSVPAGTDLPYAVVGTTIYIRQEAETSMAMRDEIVALVRRSLHAEPLIPAVQAGGPASARPSMTLGEEAGGGEAEGRPAPAVLEAVGDISLEPGAAMIPLADAGSPESLLPGTVAPPGTGVQILSTTEQKGALYHTMKDLRNGSIVHNVTRESARKLWRYAITEHETNPVQADRVQWSPEDDRLGLWKSSRRAGKVRYDLVQRLPNGGHQQILVYYGVTDDGIDGPWRVFLKE
jgi:hypothetical protein